MNLISEHFNFNFDFRIPNLFSNKKEWNYEGECGPQTWENAGGKYQSPINIETKKTVFDENLLENPLQINYDINSCYEIKNTGHTFQVDSVPNHNSKYLVLKGGPVEHEYKFLQFHMHWGDTIEKGSEHLVDGRPFAAELHFVNWNHQLYKSPSEAVKSNENDGLVVLAKFIKVGDFNPEFEKLAKCMHDIHLKNQHIPVDHIDIRKFFSKNLQDYWTYFGSLTTPPCTECVQWIIFKHPIEISAEQLEKCHELYQVSKEKFCNEHTIIRYNDRPVCNLNHRIVRRSFRE